MADCKDFLSMSPEHRWNDIEKYRFCFTCLRPCHICNSKPCILLSSVLEVLICQSCVETSQSLPWSPLNILMCRRKAHAAARTPTEKIHDQFSKYFGCTDTNNKPQDISYTVNFMHQDYSLTLVKQLNQEKPGSFKPPPPPTFHSQTGETITNPSVKIIPEVSEHTMYLIQILKIGNIEVLTFFDSGANVNLIDGDLATRENLQYISKKPTALSVVGRNQIETEYGQYKFNLGPTPENDFHTLTCLGMDSVTNEFCKYDLTEIIDEFRNKSNKCDKNALLPPYAASTSVKLLIVIRNNKLNSTLIEVLPSGKGNRSV